MAKISFLTFASILLVIFSTHGHANDEAADTQSSSALTAISPWLLDDDGGSSGGSPVVRHRPLPCSKPAPPSPSGWKPKPVPSWSKPFWPVPSPNGGSSGGDDNSPKPFWPKPSPSDKSIFSNPSGKEFSWTWLYNTSPKSGDHDESSHRDEGVARETAANAVEEANTSSGTSNAVEEVTQNLGDEEFQKCWTPIKKTENCVNDLFSAFISRKVEHISAACCTALTSVGRDCHVKTLGSFDDHAFSTTVIQHCSTI